MYEEWILDDAHSQLLVINYKQSAYYFVISHMNSTAAAATELRQISDSRAVAPKSPD